MLKIIFPFLIFSSYVQAETCKNVLDCSKLYEKLTNKKVDTQFVPADLSILADAEVNLEKNDVESKFTKFANEAGLDIISSDKGETQLWPRRRGAGITAPIYKANEEILNKLKNSKERVNLIYSAKVFPENMVDNSVRKHLSKDKDTSNNIVEFKPSNIVFVSDFGKNAYLIIKSLEARDK